MYHFPINNNLDVYAGGYVSLSLGHQIKFQYITREYATGYESKNTGNWRIPFSFAVGAGALLGADYYFRKNIAIGVSGLVGFSSSFQYGNQIEQVISTNTGSLNPRQGTTSSEQKRTLKNAYTSTGLSGGAGLNFIFFFTRKEPKIHSTTEQRLGARTPTKAKTQKR